MLEPINRRRQAWTQSRWIRFVAGSMILISLGLAIVNSGWLYLTAFVGLNLLQSAFTNWCPLIVVLRKLGVSE